MRQAASGADLRRTAVPRTHRWTHQSTGAATHIDPSALRQRLVNRFLPADYEISSVQDLLGREVSTTTVICTCALSGGDQRGQQSAGRLESTPHPVRRRSQAIRTS